MQVGDIKNRVLIGKKEYLFLYEGRQSQFDYLLEKKSIKSNLVQIFTDNQNSRKKFCDELDIEYLCVVFPSKPLVKTHFLPDNLQSVKSIYESSFKSAQSVLYPLDTLRSAEKSASTFYTLDTHNSDFGKIIIANEILACLGFSHDLFEHFIAQEIQRGGDLANMLKLDSRISEIAYLLKNKNIISISNSSSLHGNTNSVCIIHNNKSVCNKRVMIFGDSFFIDGAILGLQCFFREIIYIRSSFFHKDLVLLYRPDIVLNGYAERYLVDIKSDEEANIFLMELYGSNTKFSQQYLNALKAVLFRRFYPHIYTKWLQNPLSNDELVDSFDMSSHYVRKYKKYKNLSIFLGCGCILLLIILIIGVFV